MNMNEKYCSKDGQNKHHKLEEQRTYLSKEGREGGKEETEGGVAGVDEVEVQKQVRSRGQGQSWGSQHIQDQEDKLGEQQSTAHT